MAYTFNHALLVTDIPYLTDEVDQLTDKLEKYFGRREHGGGDIETIICPVGGSLAKAIVVFDSAEGKLIVEKKILVYFFEICSILNINKTKMTYL